MAFGELPTFSFSIWIGLLLLALTGLLAVSPLVFLGKWGMRPVSLIFAWFMLLNGLGHLLAVVYDPRLMPGAWSSPLLLAGAIDLLIHTPGSRR